MELLKKVRELKNSGVNDIVEKRLEEFAAFREKGNDEWFSELCFCILAANSKQKTAAAIEKNLGTKLMNMPQNELALFIRTSKHRFHNNKAKYIVKAREFHNVRDIVMELKEEKAREWLVDNVHGLGMKEASHFLRNTGAENLAILDRHIINLMSEHGIIERPKTLTKKSYLEIETKFRNIAKKLNISSAKLDLLMWYLKTGEILK